MPLFRERAQIYGYESYTARRPVAFPEQPDGYLDPQASTPQTAARDFLVKPDSLGAAGNPADVALSLENLAQFQWQGLADSIEAESGDYLTLKFRGEQVADLNFTQEPITEAFTQVIGNNEFLRQPWLPNLRQGSFVWLLYADSQVITDGRVLRTGADLGGMAGEVVYGDLGDDYSGGYGPFEAPLRNPGIGIMGQVTGVSDPTVPVYEADGAVSLLQVQIVPLLLINAGAGSLGGSPARPGYSLIVIPQGDVARLPSLEWRDRLNLQRAGNTAVWFRYLLAPKEYWVREIDADSLNYGIDINPATRDPIYQRVTLQTRWSDALADLNLVDYSLGVVYRGITWQVSGRRFEGRRFIDLELERRA